MSIPVGGAGAEGAVSRMSQEARAAALRAAGEAGLGELKAVYGRSRFGTWLLAVSGCGFVALLMPVVVIDTVDDGVSGKTYAGAVFCLVVLVGMLLAARVVWRNSEGGIVHFEGGMVGTDGAGSETVCARRDVTEVRRVSRNPIIPTMYAITAGGRRVTVGRDEFSRCRPLLKDIAKLAAPAPSD
ncbi:hypothetical protein [Streptomyces sp. NBC_00343]|uniref:hypothetical protein n=1 Tax=Streptomyces sp. NBC_00343 TaxID=2975719 RepID=UPI002E2E13AD|nr:hypothetical protein [Streptomyces sp. NBC_00343]